MLANFDEHLPTLGSQGNFSTTFAHLLGNSRQGELSGTRGAQLSHNFRVTQFSGHNRMDRLFAVDSLHRGRSGSRRAEVLSPVRRSLEVLRSEFDESRCHRCVRSGNPEFRAFANLWCFSKTCSLRPEPSSFLPHGLRRGAQRSQCPRRSSPRHPGGHALVAARGPLLASPPRSGRGKSASRTNCANSAMTELTSCPNTCRT